MERCRFPETAVAIAYETQGLFELAQESYEKVWYLPIYTQNNPLNLLESTPLSLRAFSITTKVISTEVPCIKSYLKVPRALNS